MNEDRLNQLEQRLEKIVGLDDYTNEQELEDMLNDREGYEEEANS